MNDELDLLRRLVIYQSDRFGSELQNFERDVHMLILGTLDAAIKNLNAEAQEQDTDLKVHIENASDTALERIGEIQQEIWGYIDDQERFLRGMGLGAC